MTGGFVASRQKPTVTELGLDIAALDWRRSGTGDGSFEVAFVPEAGGPDGAPGRAGQGDAAAAQWILLRVAGDPAGRVLVYDRVEWMCFVDGARGGEFDPGHAESDHGRRVPGEPGGRVRRQPARPGWPQQSRIPAGSESPGRGCPGDTADGRPRLPGA